jgi:hypothetical protein
MIHFCSAMKGERRRGYSPQAGAMVEKLLGKGHSLASVCSWADDICDERPASYNWLNSPE